VVDFVYKFLGVLIVLVFGVVVSYFKIEKEAAALVMPIILSSWIYILVKDKFAEGDKLDLYGVLRQSFGKTTARFLIGGILLFIFAIYLALVFKYFRG